MSGRNPEREGVGFAISSFVNLVDVRWTNFKLNREPGKFESWLERAKRFIHFWI